MRPTSCGRYQILSELGRGGMGVVYRARDGESGQEVALKLALHRMNPRRLARFQREGEITARLQHVGIVRVYSTGEVEGRPYLAYELIQGRSLDDVLEGLELRRRVELLRDAARALGYAHEQGVVHRDVKGENILVDEQGHARVADFGLATAGGLERLTQTGAMLGTPSHMAPEQVDGKGSEPTPAADVWSLGVVLYRALTGELPFVAGTMVELVGLIMAARLERPRRLDPSLPEGLERICLRALSPRPGDRYANGNAIADELDAWLAGRWRAQPRRTRWSAVVIPLGIGLLGWVVAAQLTERSEPSQDRTESPKPTKPARPRISEAQLGMARRALAKVAKLDDPRLRLEQTRRWLVTHRRLPEEEIAAGEELMRRTQLELPLLVIAHEARSAKDAGGETYVERLFSSNGRQVKAYFLGNDHLLTQGADYSLRCWDLADPSQPVWETRASPPSQNALAAHPSGGALVTSRGGPGPPGGLQVLVMDLPSLETHPVPGAPTDGHLRRVAFSPDGKLLALGSLPHGLYLYRWPDLQRLHHFPRRDLRDLEFSRDGELVAAAGGGKLSLEGRTVQRGEHWLTVWRTASGETVCDLSMPSVQTSIDFVGKRAVLAGTEVGRLQTIELDDPSRRRSFFGDQLDSMSSVVLGERAHSGEISGIWVHPDGRHALTTNSLPGNDVGVPELRVWDLQSYEQIRRVEPHRASLVSLYGSPDGTRIVVGTGFLEAQVWRAEAR